MATTELLKQCRRCREMLCVSAFQLDRHSADELQSYCRQCVLRNLKAPFGNNALLFTSRA